MSKLSVVPKTSADTKNAAVMDEFTRRLAATPAGMCPVALQVTLAQVGASQTCGKCVPCRDGLPQLARMLGKIADCEADAQTLADARALAEVIRDASDCAIG